MYKIILSLLLFPLALFALEGKVVKVQDGDTITILTSSNEQVKIRLDGIDAPEHKQAFGTASQKNLAKYCVGEIAHVEEKGKDRYKRVLGVVTCKGINVNRQQVLDGYAWAYVKYSKDYIKEEIEAKKLKKGLWIENAVPPWEFRKKK